VRILTCPQGTANPTPSLFHPRLVQVLTLISFQPHVSSYHLSFNL